MRITRSHSIFKTSDKSFIIALFKSFCSLGKNLIFSSLNISFVSFVFVLHLLTSSALFSQTVITTYSSGGASTWTCPGGVYSVTVECWGAGGGGGGAAGNPSAGGGGAAGAYSKSVLNVTPGTVYSYSVGAAGSAGAATGNTGGTGGGSWFNTSGTILAVGGTGGAGTAINSTSATGASKVSSGSVGTTKYYGGSGGTGGASGTSGGGGGSSAGTASDGNNASVNTAGSAVTGGGAGATGAAGGSPGSAGSSPGGAGSGGCANTTTDKAGAAGAAGQIKISYSGYTTAGSYTFTVPTCVNSLTVSCWGAGGGGGGSASLVVSGGGGGGGGALSQSTFNVTPGATYSLKVGTGGGAGDNSPNPGTAGTDSWFSSSTILLAKGGSAGTGGGFLGPQGTGGAGGPKASCIGTTTLSGGTGGDGNGNGGGGGSAAGTTANGNNGGAPAAGAAQTPGGGAGGAGNSGNNGSSPGGGGGGAGDATQGNSSGNGADGGVFIAFKQTYTPVIASANPAGKADGVCAGNIKDSVYRFVLTGVSSGTLTGFNFTTAGTYQATDFSKFQLWRSTSDDLSTATQVGSNLTPAAAGVQTFAAFTQTLSATNYFWITLDEVASPTNNGTFAVNAITSSNLTFDGCAGSVTGTCYASPTYTISASIQAISQAAGKNTICNTETVGLNGAAVAGSATTGAWSILSSSPAAGGSHTLSSTAQTATPQNVTFTPYGGYTGTVTLMLTSNGCITTDTREVDVISCGATSYNSSTSWTAPCGVSSVTVECWGGGGGGGGGNWVGSGGSGGGGGAYVKSVLTVTPGTSYSVNIGAGGNGGANNGDGTSGGDSWFSTNATILAKGGTFGNSDGGAAGTGGTIAASIGTTKFAGGTGGVGQGSAGSGGGASAGTAASGTVTANGTAGGVAPTGGGNGGAGSGSTDGAAGTAPGGGGGGGDDSSGPVGGAGAAGRVTITPSLTHPSATAGTAITACAGMAANICAGDAVSNYHDAQWTTLDGTGTFGSSTSTVNATYTPSTTDKASGSVIIILTANASDGTSTCDTYGEKKLFYVYPDSSWGGASSSSWATAGNWCNGVPTSTVSVIIPASAPNQPNVSASGAVCKNITINSGASLTMTTTNTLGIYGNWTNNGTFTKASSVVHMKGASSQIITGSSTQTFYDLTINNTGSSGSDLITLNQPVTVSDVLTLTDGVIVPSSTNSLVVTNTSGSAVSSGSAASFVKGPLTWSVTAGQTYTFPTGYNTATWRRVGLSSVSAAGAFTCQYFNVGYVNHTSGYLSTATTPTLTTLSNQEYWDVTRTSGAASAAVTLYWESASTSGINTCTVLTVAHYTGGLWENAGRGSTSGTCSGAAAGSITGTLQSTFSPETFGGTSTDPGNIDPLPIELISFGVVYDGRNTEVKWSTASEINNNYFTIERSTDGVNFTVVSVVPSSAENGNSSIVLNYSVIDLNYTPGTYYYRLKQTDFDGKYKYSEVKTVSIKDYMGFNFDIAPNPNNGREMTMYITAFKNEDIVLSIVDIIGQQLYTQTFTTIQDGISSIPIYISDKLNPGIYIFTAAPPNHQSVAKRIVVE